MKFKRILYDITYAIKTVIFGQKLPYMFGLQITDNCNLNCFYCEGKNAGKVNLSFNDGIITLYNAYKRGNRSLYFTGGEPMLWNDNEKTLTDLVNYAYSLGFYDILIVTNGTQPLTIQHVSYLVTIG